MLGRRAGRAQARRRSARTRTGSSRPTSWHLLGGLDDADISFIRHFLAAVPDAQCHLWPGDVGLAARPWTRRSARTSCLGVIRASASRISSARRLSSIVMNAHAISMGRLPVCSPQGVVPVLGRSTMRGGGRRRLSGSARVLPQQVLAADGHPVLAPCTQLACGTDNLNKSPGALGEVSAAARNFPRTRRTFRLGDKVIQTKNNFTRNPGLQRRHLFRRGHRAGLARPVHGDELEVDYENGRFGELRAARL